MTTPVDERPEPTYAQPSYNMSNPGQNPQGRSSLDRPSLPSYNVNHPSQREARANSSEEGTMIDETDANGHHDRKEREESEHKYDGLAPHGRPRSGSHLTVETQYEPRDPLRNYASPTQTREQANRLDDDLTLLKIERQISRQEEEDELSRSKSRGGDTHRSKSRTRTDHVDEFDEATNPVHEKTQVYKPVEHPTTKVGKFLKRVHQSNFLIRWFTYILPVTLILLIPLLLGALLFENAVVGGVYLVWFMIWLEIVWLTLWAGRVLAKCLPWPIGMFSSFFTNNSKKWRDMGKQLELPATLFFWWLAIEISFLPTMKNHQRDHPYGYTPEWMGTMNKVLVSFLVGAVLNFVEKIIIQLIAISFHLRTYADRIEINKFQIGSLTKLYTFSKEKIAMDDAEFEEREGPGSGARTPGQALNEAKMAAKQGFSKFGDVAGKVAGDFTGRQVTKSTHPTQVVLALLGSTSGAQVLARRLYRTFAREDIETVIADDLRPAFENDEEATAAFTMFDKDMNGDISMEELEAVCVEIGRERKSITASLKDLDSVVAKLDDVFMFIVCVIVILVFISLISTSAAGVLTSAGSAVLALSWLFSATAQEFLQSVIFVFVKHPFDVGDRVGIYGNTGSMLKGDDYFVKEISLLYTEFKKMEGHIVQAPNSYLNTLFILNQRRSGGLAEAVSITIKFGTTLEQIDGLRTKLLEFVKSEKREYQGNILTELRDIVEVHSMNLNVVFFYKSNWQNEGLRLARRNKFICAMMVTMQELGIEGPYMRFPGMRASFPMYLSNIPHVGSNGAGHNGTPDHPHGTQESAEGYQDPPFVAPAHGQEDPAGSETPHSRMRSGSILKHSGSSRARGETLSNMSKRVDFSLGMKSYAAMGDLTGDVYEDRNFDKPRIDIIEASRERERSEARARSSQERAARASYESAHSTGRDAFVAGGLARRATDASGRARSSMHRNRFFGRSHGEADDMERGVAMADIPEESRNATASNTPGGRIDPRSGMVSPAAWRMTTDESNLHPPVPPQLPRQVSGNGTLGNVPHVEVPEGHRTPGGVGRSQTLM
ncbi:Putative EF-hand domain, mechanosensitive ion channel MscS, LSM domain superfamily [Septoria linicola]|uniref:Mechanosensitive ion channel protein n=1 Tax=Septoria linicola TaxID=215465 RepID=A0A9Q9AJE5_9PEZI|nr:putative EF-hand domain, mechanosensitive ion channel MscS, LSM domain superfamily [Septoria linicola]USW47187.1 Putative EF-hand domain, mechanosensitive ion channel MscS, LSM domain superfamily [Septoria linicola]